MRKKRFSVEQMIGVLKQAEVGVRVAEVIRKGRDQRTDVLPVEGEAHSHPEPPYTKD
jgi:hypothetical protein